jgi:ribosylpyrimidine nucleosidase
MKLAMEKPMNVILDSDPGHDDAVAILLAGSSEKINLLGISVVSGNQTIEKTTVNALHICEYLGIDVPVAMGAERPLKKMPMICPEIHGASGLDGVSFPSLHKKVDLRQGYQLIIDLCLSHQDVILVPTGPLTNIALALTHEPKIKDHISKIVLMGGSMGFGNVTPAAEFNILVDPEAAEIVFASGLSIYMNGLDVTREVLVHQSIIDRMDKIDNIASHFFHDLMVTFNANQKKVFGWVDGGPLHDPVTIVSLLDPKCVTYQAMNVTIDVSGGPSYGRTNCDRYDYLHLPKNAFVATSIDVARYWAIIEEGIRAYS